MELPTYVKEAVERIKFANETTHSVDGFIIKLESAVSHILEYGSENDLELFFDILVDKGLLNRLSCYKEDLEQVLSSPRHPLIRKYSSLLYNALERAPCVEGFKYIIPPPSYSAKQISWGRRYRDERQRREVIPLRKRSTLINLTVEDIIAIFLLVFIISLLVYSIYTAVIMLATSFILNGLFFNIPTLFTISVLKDSDQ
jgi:hypothetical protein